MELRTDAEVAHTRVLLKEFQERYAQLRADPSETPRIKELTLWSLKKQINQFIEDIARYESRLHKV